MYNLGDIKVPTLKLYLSPSKPFINYLKEYAQQSSQFQTIPFRNRLAQQISCKDQIKSDAVQRSKRKSVV